MDPFAKLQLPEPMSNHASHVDPVFMGIFYGSALMFLGIVACVVWWSIKYRRKSRDERVPDPLPHMPRLEAAWTIAPFFIVFALFHVGFKGYAKMTTVPAGAIQVRVFASKWSWSFQYENGGSKDRLVVPLNKPVKLIISSSDVLHAVYIPAFRVKRDAVPGQYSTLWFTPTMLGKTDLFCAEYCGGVSDNPDKQKGHWSMHADVEVVSEAAYDEFLKGILGPQNGETIEAYGERMYNEKGCFSCHSTKGDAMSGPTWKGLYGKIESFTDGSTHEVDEAYILESMENPNAKVVRGFNPNVMPSYAGQFQPVEQQGIIAFIKSLK